MLKTVKIVVILCGLYKNRRILQYHKQSEMFKALLLSIVK